MSKDPKHTAASPRTKAPGAPPGQLVYTGDHLEAPVSLSHIVYDAEVLEERSVEPGDPIPLPMQGRVTWLNVDGLHDTDLVARIGEAYGIHPLVLEDVVNVRERPMMQELQGQVFVSCRMLQQAGRGQLSREQVSFVVGSGFVLSFQEVPGDVFDPVRERLRSGRGRIRSSGPDYLAYALIDRVVDGYGLILEDLVAILDDLQGDALDADNESIPTEIQRARRSLTVFRAAVFPLAEAIDDLMNDPPPIFEESTIVFLTDVRSHLARAEDLADSFRDGLNSVMDTHLSALAMRSNQTMQVLTLFASIFLPLTFLAGIYGMNFRHMPELEVPWAYPLVLAVMVFVAVGMVLFFRRKKWL